MNLVLATSTSRHEVSRRLLAPVARCTAPTRWMSVAAQTVSQTRLGIRVADRAAVPSPVSRPSRVCQKKRKPKQSKEEEEAAAKRQRELLEATAKSFYEDQGL